MGKHDWVPKWVRCMSLPCLKDIFADVRMDAHMLGRTHVHMEVRLEAVMDIWADVFTNTRMDVNPA